jgi:uncharacterized protein with ATP-grasp and redox domains
VARRIMSMINSNDPFRLVAQCLNQLRHRVAPSLNKSKVKAEKRNGPLPVVVRVAATVVSSNAMMKCVRCLSGG